jgi:hypothetical protein
MKKFIYSVLLALILIIPSSPVFAVWEYHTKTIGIENVLRKSGITYGLQFTDYNNQTHNSALIARTTGNEYDIMLDVENGKFYVPDNQELTVRVQFDNGPVETYEYTAAMYGADSSIFIRSEETFIANLCKAKVVKIETTFIGAGVKVLTFDVSGFNINRIK